MAMAAGREGGEMERVGENVLCRRRRDGGGRSPRERRSCAAAAGRAEEWKRKEQDMRITWWGCALRHAKAARRTRTFQRRRTYVYAVWETERAHLAWDQLAAKSNDHPVGLPNANMRDEKK